jgi:hypothetical protein
LILDDGCAFAHHQVNVGMRTTLSEVIGAICGVIVMGEQDASKCARSLFFTAALWPYKQICMYGLCGGSA